MVDSIFHPNTRSFHADTSQAHRVNSTRASCLSPASSMDLPDSTDPGNPFSLGTDSADEEGPHEILVHGLKAKFFLNRPVTDLLPDRFLERAENFCESPVSSFVSTSEWTM